MWEETIELCDELELLFDFTEGRISLNEYHNRMNDLQRKREKLLQDAGMLAGGTKKQVSGSLTALTAT